MTAFSELDEYLGKTFSDDYWSDEGELQAHAIVRRFGERDWEELRASWQQRGESWQTRCAQILSHGSPRQAIPTVLQMLGSNHKESRIAALDSLREMDLNYLQVQDVQRVAIVIEHSLRSADAMESLVLNALKRQIAARCK